jgi:hypothetical protein
MWQTFVHVNNSSHKHVNEDTTLPQDFQRGGLENKQLEVVKLGYPIMLKEKMLILTCATA